MIHKRSQSVHALIALLISMASQSLVAQRLNPIFVDYIARFNEVAMENQVRHKIPASITLAQGLFESGAGQSRLAKQANNHFGIKCGGDWRGPSISHDDDARGECFRVYRDAKASYDDHASFLTGRPRYAHLFQLNPRNYEAWAWGLSRAGYATAKDYAPRLIKIIEEYGLHRYNLEADRYVSQKKRHGSRYGSTEDTVDQKELISDIQHEVIRINGIKAILEIPGDNYRSIAREKGISIDKLIEYNDAQNAYSPIVGGVVYLGRKKTKAAEPNFVHEVKRNESLYIISQKYCIRLESLYRLNKLPADYVARVGDKLLLR